MKTLMPKSYRSLFLTFVIGFTLISCTNNVKPTPPTEPQSAAKISVPIQIMHIPKDSVLTINIPADPTQSYTIYFPNTAKSVETTSVLICFDPHGDGRIPIDKYRKWADKLGVAIAGSNSSRNGLSGIDGEQIAANMISDINSRLGFDKRNMTLCGFSGGAKVAISAISQDGGIYNLIYAGAVTALNSAKPLNILGFAGNQDMNYTDLLQFDENIRPSNPNNALIEFTGKHEWPDAQTFENAFCWIVFQSWKQNNSTKDSSMIVHFEKKCDKEIAEAEKQGNWIKAYEESHVAYIFLNGLADVSLYKSKMESIAAKDQYKRAIADKNQTLQKEAGEKQMLLQAFQNQGSQWWIKVISGYRASSYPSDKRLLGFISLASYSYSSQMLAQHNLDDAERILAIYELDDPLNTDQLYFHAMLYAQKGNKMEALQYLKKAVSNGFNDPVKIENEASFTPLRNDPGYLQTVAALKKASR